MALNEKQQKLCNEHPYDFSNLTALFLNCTLKPSGNLSHTEVLMNVSQAIMDTNGISTEVVRAVDYNLPPGVYPDMTEHGFERDDWPQLCKKVMDADILILGTPIWLWQGEFGLPKRHRAFVWRIGESE